MGFPGGFNSKVSACLQRRRPEFDPRVGKIPWRRKRQPTPVLLPGKSCGQRSLVGYSPWGGRESDTAERLHFHFQHTELIIFFIVHLYPCSLDATNRFPCFLSNFLKLENIIF